METPKIKIFTAFHKPFQTPNDKYHIPVHVGKAISSVKLPFIGDDTGDNMSEKNPNYCELTMLYWIWKNCKLTEDDYVGLAHYRRLFDTRNIEKYINKYDIIVPKKLTLTFYSIFITLECWYKYFLIPEDFDQMKDVLYSLYPEYKKYDYIYTKKHLFYLKGYFCNMFIMKKDLFLEYCERLFSILFECEKRVQISIYPYQARIFGFMGEWLFNIWIEKKKKEGAVKIKENKIIYL